VAEANDAIGRVADAIYKSQVDRARELAGAYEIKHERLRRVFEVAFSESDRSAAILLFSLGEDLMLEAFKKYLNAEISGGWKTVFDGNGVLATAADRITMLHLLHWIRPGTCADLGILKSIRNRFAHHADVESFEDTKIRGWVASLSPREQSAFKAFSPDEVAGWRKFKARELYFMRATGTLVGLVTDLAIGPVSRFERVSPRDVGGTWDNTPENLRSATKLAAEALLWCMPPR
jgi:hypothetical protein